MEFLSMAEYLRDMGCLSKILIFVMVVQYILNFVHSCKIDKLEEKVAKLEEKSLEATK